MWESCSYTDRAVDQAVIRRLPTVVASDSSLCAVIRDLRWTERHRGMFSLSTSFSPATH
jgi:hypothetical protein